MALSLLPPIPLSLYPRYTRKVISLRGIEPLMSAPKNPRITLDPGAYHALCIQAAIEQTTPGSLASRVILSYSQEAKQALQATGRMAPSTKEAQTPREVSFQDPTMGESQTPQEGGSHNSRTVVREVGRSPERETPIEGEKKVRLFQNPQALAKIKELWEGGQRNQAEIARVIGYDKATVNDNIRKMLKVGTLSPQDQ